MHVRRACSKRIKHMRIRHCMSHVSSTGAPAGVQHTVHDKHTIVYSILHVYIL